MTGAALTAFAFVAGLLSILSPCVLPILPLALGSAVTSHRYGAIALGAGLALSFTAIGMFVATIGFAAGIGNGVFQTFGAAALLLMGTVLVIPGLQSRLALATGPISNWADNRFGGGEYKGLPGQFGLGLLFGLIWTPCAGPSLGAAALMASNGRNLPEVVVIMLAFGIGATLPLVILGSVSRSTLLRWRGRLTGSGTFGKAVLGATLIAFSLLILTGANQTVETFLVDHLPQWLLAVTSRY